MEAVGNKGLKSSSLRSGNRIHTENLINPFYRQLCLSMVCMSFGFMVGLSQGTPTVAVPQLKQHANSTSAVSDEMASWITSITPYAGILWVFIIVIFAHNFGRRITVIVAGFNTLATYLVIYYSKHVMHIFISQFMQGMTQAAHTTVCMMVVTEYTSPKYRGVFMTLKSAALNWGIWVANAIGTFFHYKNIGLVGIACSIYNLAVFLFMPESPFWLATQKKFNECAVAYRWLKGENEESEKELDALIKSRKDNNENGSVKLSLFGFLNYYSKVLRDPEIYKPLLLSLLVIFMLNFSGKLICNAYAVEIMKKITESTSAAYTVVLVLDGFTIVGSYTGCFLSKFLKRRTLLIGASSACVVFQILLSLYLYLVKTSTILENNYICIIILVAYSLAVSCGPLILTTTLFGELSPVKHRSFTVCIICIESKFVIGTLLKLGPYIFKTFDVHGSFLFFSVVLSTCIILAYKYLPETKDKTLQEISEYFKKEITKNNNMSQTKLLEDGRN